MPGDSPWWELKAALKSGRIELSDALTQAAAHDHPIVELVCLALLAPSNHRDHDPASTATLLLNTAAIPEARTVGALTPEARDRLLVRWSRAHAPQPLVQA